jgi:hypothetical protein
MRLQPRWLLLAVLVAVALGISLAIVVYGAVSA